MDSTKVTGDGLGQFVNDAIACEANCKMKMIQVTKQPQLALYATRKIQKNEEIRYDYGVSDLPWRNLVSILSLLDIIQLAG